MRRVAALVAPAGLLLVTKAQAYSGKAMAADGIAEWLLLVLFGAPLAGALITYGLLLTCGLFATSKVLYPRPGIVLGVSAGTWWVGIAAFFLLSKHLAINTFIWPIGGIASVALLFNYRIYRRQIFRSEAA